jgi:hypothetical protein
MIGQESSNLLGEQNHGKHNRHGGPEQNLPEETALYRALLGTALLPESHTDQREGEHKEPRPKAQQEGAGAGSANGSRKAERHAARHGGERAHNRHSRR